MDKLQIAIIFGGCSSEYEVSLESAYAVIKNLDREKYRPLPVGVTREGDWFFYSGDVEKIPVNQWQNPEDVVPVVFSPNRSAHTLLLLHEDRVEPLPIDLAFPVMHGKNGEDGTVQGLLEAAGIPLAGCGVLSSALCMDKDRAHKLAGLAGVLAPKSLVANPYTGRQAILDFAGKTGYPLFVKPVKAGSSYGVTKVLKAEELFPAVDLAFQYDDEVIIEENIDGFEVGVAVIGNEELTVGEVDEIELFGGFFDFTEKYTLKTSAIHVPARISPEKAEEIKETAKTIYKALNCSGFARVDLFLTPDGRIYFNEINTIPGFTEHSRFPGMMKARGISFPEILSRIIGLAVMK